MSETTIDTVQIFNLLPFFILYDLSINTKKESYITEKKLNNSANIIVWFIVFIKCIDIFIPKFKIDKTRQDKTRQDKTRQDKTRQDKTRQDKTRQDKTRICKRYILYNNSTKYKKLQAPFHFIKIKYGSL